MRLRRDSRLRAYGARRVAPGGTAAAQPVLALLRAWALWLTHDAASEVIPPTTDPDRAAIAEK